MTHTSQHIETKVARIWLDDRGFLVIKFFDTKELFDAEEAQAQLHAAAQLTDGQPLKVLVDTPESTHVPTLEAKRIIADLDKKIKEAVVVNTLGNKILGNIYMKIINKRYPSKIFSDQESAIAWLLED